jgi:putative transposase
MTRCPSLLRNLMPRACTLLMLLMDAWRFLLLGLHPRPALAAENLFLRKQLALYQERGIKPRRPTPAIRIVLTMLARVFWRWPSRVRCPPIPAGLQALIRRMARENSSWGQERIANELLLKLGVRVSPRTVRKYLPRSHDCRPKPGVSSQRWRTFVRNHAEAIVACDFCVVVTATFRLLYIFVVMEHATRRMLHANVTAHPTSAWTMQQFRDAIPADHTYRFLIQDRDTIFSHQLDQTMRHLGLRVVRTPVRRPQANAYCERLLGTLRRECLDFLIPLTENHLRRLLKAWVQHYNAGRPHVALGPGIPQPPPHLPMPTQEQGHRLPEHLWVVARPILGGLHHEYWFEEKAA